MAIYEGSFTNAKTLKVGIVIARFNDLITTKMIDHFITCSINHRTNSKEPNTKKIPV